jgi:hypothetical protein
VAGGYYRLLAGVITDQSEGDGRRWMGWDVRDNES